MHGAYIGTFLGVPFCSYWELLVPFTMFYILNLLSAAIYSDTSSPNDPSTPGKIKQRRIITKLLLFVPGAGLLAAAGAIIFFFGAIFYCMADEAYWDIRDAIKSSPA